MQAISFSARINGCSASGIIKFVILGVMGGVSLGVTVLVVFLAKRVSRDEESEDDRRPRRGRDGRHP